MKLSKIDTERNKGFEKKCIITVDYCPDTYQVELKSIVVEERRYMQVDNTISYSPLSNRIDVTDLFLEQFPFINESVKNLDWENIYKEQLIAA